MNKLKITVVAICVVILCIISFALFRFVQGMLFTAAHELQQAGEAPIAQPTEEAWVAPTMSLDALDVEAGISNVNAEMPDDARATEPPLDDDDDDVQSIPVEETADELADTQPDEADLGQSPEE